MYSPRLYKYRDSYVLYKPAVHTFGTVTLHTLFWCRHTHITFPPPDAGAENELEFTLTGSRIRTTTSALSYSLVLASSIRSKDLTCLIYH